METHLLTTFCYSSSCQHSLLPKQDEFEQGYCKLNSSEVMFYPLISKGRVYLEVVNESEMTFLAPRSEWAARAQQQRGIRVHCKKWRNPARALAPVWKKSLHQWGNENARQWMELAIQHRTFENEILPDTHLWACTGNVIKLFDIYSQVRLSLPLYFIGVKANGRHPSCVFA